MAISPRGLFPQRRRVLTQQGIGSDTQLLHVLPQRQQLYLPQAGEAVPANTDVAIIARVKKSHLRRFKRQVIISATLQRLDDNSTVQAQWFGAAWIRQHLQIDEPRLWIGRSDRSGKLLRPQFQTWPDQQRPPDSARLYP